MKPWLRLTLITATVGGGFTGIAVTFQALLDPRNQSPLLLMGFFLALFTYVTVSGLIFVQNPERKRPLIAALAIQIPWISSPFVVYEFAAGCRAVLSLRMPEQVGLPIDTYIPLGSGWRFFLLQSNPWSIGINIFPLVILVSLLRSIRAPHSVVSLTASSPSQNDPALIS